MHANTQPHAAEHGPTSTEASNCSHLKRHPASLIHVIFDGVCDLFNTNGGDTMGLMSGLLGNASEIPVAEAQAELQPILLDGETIEHAFKLIRDQIIFTSKRVITVDKQGLTGSKQNIRSIPYKSIKMISKEGAGMLDLDAELVLWITGEAQPLKFEFKKGVDINAVYRLVCKHVL